MTKIDTVLALLWGSSECKIEAGRVGAWWQLWKEMKQRPIGDQFLFEWLWSSMKVNRFDVDTSVALCGMNGELAGVVELEWDSSGTLSCVRTCDEIVDDEYSSEVLYSGIKGLWSTGLNRRFKAMIPKQASDTAIMTNSTLWNTQLPFTNWSWANL